VEPFDATDFARTRAGSATEFACRTLHGEKLAEPAVITIDYTAGTAKISQVSAASWMPLPDDRKRYQDRCEWYLNALARHALKLVADGKPASDAMKWQNISWMLSSTGLLPFDLKISVTDDTPRKAVIEIGSSFGRALPFRRLRYVTQEGAQKGAFQD
jgi:hypothetical protein